MGLSARLLGREYNLTAEEMNVLLKNAGYINGDAKEYYATEKGKPFFEKQYHQRGNGGYSRYNTEWETITYDESILDDLKDTVTPGLIQEAREEVRERRASRTYTDLEQEIEEDTEDDEEEAYDTESQDSIDFKTKFQLTEEAKSIIKGVAIGVAGAGILTVASKFTVPRIKNFVIDRKNKKRNSADGDEEKESNKETEEEAQL